MHHSDSDPEFVAQVLIWPIPLTDPNMTKKPGPDPRKHYQILYICDMYILLHVITDAKRVHTHIYFKKNFLFYQGLFIYIAWLTVYSHVVPWVDTLYGSR